MRSFTFLVAIFGLSNLVGNCKKDTSLKVIEETESGSNISLRDFIRYGYNKEGEVTWKLQAKESFIHSNEKKTSFYTVNFIQYEKGKIKSTLLAGKGEIDNQNKQLQLQDKVKLTTSDSIQLMETNSLVYSMEDKTYSTEDPVSIITNGTRIEGIGLVGNKEENTFTILKPTAITSAGSNPISKKKQP